MWTRCPNCTAEEVIAQVARDHAQQLARVAQQEGLTSDDALDAVQEALHRCLTLRQERELDPEPDATRALLIGIVRNEARNMRRRHHRAAVHEDVATTLETRTPSTETLLEAEEDRLRLIGCVRQLADRERAVVTLRMLEELSGSDVARALGLTPGHVAVLLHRAKGSLLQCMCD